MRPTIDEIPWDTTATNKLVTKGTLTPQKIKISSDKIPDSFSLPLIRCISLTKAIKTFKISLQNSGGGVIPLIKQYLNFFHQSHYNTAYYTPVNRELKQWRRQRQWKRLSKSEFPLFQNSSPLLNSFNLTNVGDFFQELNSKGLHLSSQKEKEDCCGVFTSSIKREIRKFHAAVVQWRQRNVQKSVMHVQSCCFANLNLLLFCRSLCRRRRRSLGPVYMEVGDPR